MTLDFAPISVFHFSKPDDDQVQFQIRATSPRDRKVLLDLGVRNSSVYLTNATLWIEGITDRLYLRAYMTKYVEELNVVNSVKARALAKLKEDYHYSFVEYQGANLNHWSFDPGDDDTERIKASFICAHAFLIADGDIKTKGNREDTYRAMLEDRFYVLPAKEIENLIPSNVLKKVIAYKFEEFGKDPEEICYEDYFKDTLGLGEYLDNLLSVSSAEAVFAAESGTVKANKKRWLCERTLEVTRDPEFEWSLTPALTDLCKSVFNHILRGNHQPMIE